MAATAPATAAWRAESSWLTAGASQQRLRRKVGCSRRRRASAARFCRADSAGYSPGPSTNPATWSPGNGVAVILPRTDATRLEFTPATVTTPATC